MNNVNMEKEQINVAEILSNCQAGMKLDCVCFDNVVFDRIDNKTRIRCFVGSQRDEVSFNEYGCLNSSPSAKCVIFPKGQTTWEGFQEPFKDGDILAYTSGIGTTIFIHRNKKGEHTYKTSFYAGVNSMGHFLTYNKDFLVALCGDNDTRLATEEEKAKLFQAIKYNGYRWNSKTKTLEKLIPLKFKIGDRIKSSIDQIVYSIIDIKKDTYVLSGGMEKINFHVPFKMEKYYDLVCPKFNISALNPFERVLVRDTDTDEWVISFFSHCDDFKIYTYICINGNGYAQCIPYKHNEHLRGTTNSCDEFYKVWKI